MPINLQLYRTDGHTHWTGTPSQRELVTNRSPGDTFKDWKTGWVWGVTESQGPWVQLYRELPECRKIDPDDYTL